MSTLLKQGLSRRQFVALTSAAFIGSNAHASTVGPRWRQLLFTGQSLALGARAPFTQDEMNLKSHFAKVPRASMVLLPNTDVPGDPTPGGLQRFHTYGLFQPALGTANISARVFGTVAPDLLLLNTSALGDSIYPDIKKGGTQPWVYDRLVRFMLEAKNQASAANADCSLAAVCVCHGETDASTMAINGETEQNARATYLGYLSEWRADFTADAMSLGIRVEGGNAVRMLVQQMTSWRRPGVDGTQGGFGNAGVTLAQLDAHERGTHVVVAPTYAFEHVDHYHLTRPGYQQLGEMFAYALEAESVQAGSWAPLRPLAVTHPLPTQVNVQMQGGRLPYHFEALPIQSSLTAPQGTLENYGFCVRAFNGVIIPIVRVALVGDVVKIFTSKRIPPGSTVSYGMGSHIGNQSMGGNLRDSSTFFSMSGKILRHWCLLFKKDIPA